MNRGLPDITESSTELKDRLRGESVGYKKQRLTALYLLQSGNAKNRKQVADLIGVNRQTVGHCLDGLPSRGSPTDVIASLSPRQGPLCFVKHNSKHCVQNLTNPLALVAMERSSNLSLTVIKSK